VNLFVTEGIFSAAFVGGMFLSFSHSKLLYLAIDLAFRPLDPDDLTTPLEKAGVRRQ